MDKENKQTLGCLLAAAVLYLAGLFIPFPAGAKPVLFAAACLLSGYEVLWSALKNLLHGGFLDEEFLMTVAVAGAFAIGDFPEAAAVMIFYQTGELLQDIAVGKSRKSVAELMDIRPDTAVVLCEGEEKCVTPAEVRPGDIVLLRAGEKIPVDGVIVEGKTSVDTSALTGESMPCERAEGEQLLSGCINLTGCVKMKAQSSFGESTVSKVLELVEHSAEKKAKTEGIITTFARYYTPCVVAAAVLLAVVAPLFFHAAWSEWIRRALTFLVISCPCALVVSVPLTFFSAIGAASKQGVLIKGAVCVEALAKADTAVFDKTGTLTEGVFSVEAVHPHSGTQAELLDIASTAEGLSSHPIAESLAAARTQPVERNRLHDVKEYAGMGVRAMIGESTYYVGNRALMELAGAVCRDCHRSGTVVHVSRGEDYLGHIVVSDRIKPSSAQTVAELKSAGIKRTVMLTGDKENVAQETAQKLGIDEVKAELLPAKKVEELERILSSGKKTVFVGDGINDAPALMRADIGIAMGAMGSDAAIESADIVLMDDDPEKIVFARKTALKTMRIVKENIVFSLLVKAAVLLLGAFAAAGMEAAVFADVGVTVLAVLNALRVLYSRKTKSVE